jgi:hypothetical protein
MRRYGSGWAVIGRENRCAIAERGDGSRNDSEMKRRLGEPGERDVARAWARET